MEIIQSQVKGEAGDSLWADMYADTKAKAPGSKRKDYGELVNPWQRAWYEKNREKAMAQNKAYKARNWASDKRRRAQYHQDRKRLVLERYGKDGKAACCWPGCDVTDLDMLSLDHVYDDGAEHRRQIGHKNIVIYRWCIRENFPPGFQTMCMNHQIKKRIQHVKANRGY